MGQWILPTLQWHKACSNWILWTEEQLIALVSFLVRKGGRSLGEVRERPHRGKKWERSQQNNEELLLHYVEMTWWCLTTKQHIQHPTLHDRCIERHEPVNCPHMSSPLFECYQDYMLNTHNILRKKNQIFQHSLVFVMWSLSHGVAMNTHMTLFHF